ncbi:MAG: hypothetical protein HQL34_10225 [Alphaproteobacteria bacterium]|nr:hypothetical protein [Alphaproteobacteria bacterium]
MSAIMGKRTLTDVTWTEGKTAHKATVVAWLGAPGGVMILRDAFDIYHVARAAAALGAAFMDNGGSAAGSGAGAVEIIGGPATVESALAAAEAAFTGHDHGSVTALIGTLALGVIASRVRQVEGAAHADR